jgi:microcystin-dependent protein
MIKIIGSVQSFHNNENPEDFFRCDGSILLINEYPFLFSSIGTTFGGDGETTFQIPNNLEQEIPDVEYWICYNGDSPRNG